MAWGRIHRRLIQNLARVGTNQPKFLQDSSSARCTLQSYWLNFSLKLWTQYTYKVHNKVVQTKLLTENMESTILFWTTCFQSFTSISVYKRTNLWNWLCVPAAAAARPSGFAVIVVTSNLLIPDSSCLWLGINGQPLETHRTHQTYWKRLKFNSLEIWHLTVIEKSWC